MPWLIPDVDVKDVELRGSFHGLGGLAHTSAGLLSPNFFSAPGSKNIQKHPVVPGCFASGLGRGQGADGRTGRRLSESSCFSQLGEIHDIPGELPPGKHTKSY